MIRIDEDGVIRNGDSIIGEFSEDEQRLVLDAGWLRMAKVKITVLGDPQHDRQRKVFERPKDEVRNAAGTDQVKLPVDGGGGGE